MTLTKHEMEGLRNTPVYETGRVQQYRISGLPPGENALIAEFPQHGWRILRWNDEWHGNWTGRYATVDAAVKALREELLAAA